MLLPYSRHAVAILSVRLKLLCFTMFSCSGHALTVLGPGCPADAMEQKYYCRVIAKPSWCRPHVIIALLGPGCGHIMAMWSGQGICHVICSICVLVPHALPLRRGVFVLHVFYIGWLHDSTLPHRRGDVVRGGQCCGRPSDVVESTHMHGTNNVCTRSYNCVYIAWHVCSVLLCCHNGKWSKCLYMYVCTWDHRHTYHVNAFTVVCISRRWRMVTCTLWISTSYTHTLCGMEGFGEQCISSSLFNFDMG